MGQTEQGTLDRLDRYFDAVPRSDASVEEVGPFSLFKGGAGASYYARPRLGLAASIDAADVQALEQRCDALGLDTSIEWIAELTPSLEAAAAAAGLAIHHHRLLVLDDVGDFRPSEIRPPFQRSVLDPADLRVFAARAVAEVSFAAGGTAIGAAGVTARATAETGLSDARKTRLTTQASTGVAITAVALDPVAGVVASGVLQPVGTDAEIVAVATLPAFRRAGLAAAVSSALVEKAHKIGVTHLLLSAESDAVARIYESIGFRCVGTHVAAEHVAAE